MNLRRRILLFSGFFLLGLTIVVGLATDFVVARQIARIETRTASETATRARRVLVSLGYARLQGSTLHFTNTFDPKAIQRTTGAIVTRRTDDGRLPADWVRVRDRLKASKANTVLVSGMTRTGVVAWTSGVDGRGRAVLLRLDVPRRLAELRHRLMVGLAGALLLGGLLLGTSTMLVIDRMVLRRLQARLIDKQDASGELAFNSDADILSELETVRKAGRESEEMFRLLAINASDMLYAMYPDSGRMEWYGQIDRMLGYTQGSFPRTIEAWAEHIHPDEQDEIVALYTSAMTGSEPFQTEYRMRYRNGSYRHWSHRGRPMFDSLGRLIRVIGSCTDVTDRRRAEIRLKESEEKLTRLFETAADAILICDPDARITMANPAAENIFGAGRDEIVGLCYDGCPYTGNNKLTNGTSAVMPKGASTLNGDSSGDADSQEPKGRWTISATGGGEFPREQWPSVWATASGEALYHIEHAVEQTSGRIVVVSVNAAPLRDADDNMIGTVLSISDITGRKALEERLAFQAFHDPLTTLPNRALFTDRLEHALVRAKRNKSGIAVFFIDLDNFKRTNDTLGHDAGDVLLKETAARLKSCIRGVDTAARLAGDEFTLLLDNVTEIGGALIVADRVLQTLLQTVHIKGQDVYAPPSIGIALSFPDDAPEDVMKRADAAMYRAKQNGKARYEVWEESLAVH